MKILLVEDEPALVSAITRGLADAGMAVSVAADGTMGLEMALQHPFDAVILDIMLPGLNGIQVCRAIREHNQLLPVLMLTALDSTENIVTGLESGADDYLAKPFKFAELEARIRSLVRRSKTTRKPDATVKIGKLNVDTDSRTVRCDGKPVALTATEYRLLEYLVKNPDKVLSRVQILENVWDINFNMGTNVVDVYINYLRRKIDQEDPKLLHTVIGMGYLLKSGLR